MQPFLTMHPEVWAAVTLLNIVTVTLAFGTTSSTTRGRIGKLSLVLGSILLAMCAWHLSKTPLWAG